MSADALDALLGPVTKRKICIVTRTLDDIVNPTTRTRFDEALGNAKGVSSYRLSRAFAVAGIGEVSPTSISEHRREACGCKEAMSSTSS